MGFLDHQLEASISAVEDHVKPLNAATAHEKENVIPAKKLIKCTIQEKINKKNKKKTLKKEKHYYLSSS